MIDALADRVALLDEQATIIAVNTSWQRFAEANALGSAHYGLGLNYLQVCERATGPNAEQAPLVARGLRRLLARRQGEFRCEYPCHSPSEKGWFQLWATCFQDRSHLYLVLAHQNVTAIKQSQQELELHDITQRKQVQAALFQVQAELESRVHERTASLAQANEALRNSERRLAMFAAATFEGIAVSQHGRFTDVNEQLAKMLGYRREELLGLEISTLIPPPERPRVMENIVRGRESHIDHAMLRKDGSVIFVEAHGQTFELEGQPTRLTALRDITERRRLQEALAHFTEELDHLVQERTSQLRETIEELEHFSYALLHDMRAPLRAMMSFANLIEMQCATTCGQPQILGYLNRIKASSERMDHLVRDALNYTRVLRRDFPVRPVPLLPLLHGLIESYPELWPHQAQIHLAPNLPAVLGNEAVLTECFSNLLRNAVKFVAPGHPPDVRLWAEEVRNEANVEGQGPSGTEHAPRNTEHASRTPQEESHSALRTPHSAFIRVWVEDNGIGIPPEEHEAIFTMFRQVHPANVFPGTGIGLAIVRKGLQRIGGRVGVESNPGQGSRFWVELEAAPTPGSVERRA